MAKLTTRTLTTTTVTSDNKPKGSALTHNELDSNFLNLETDKLENTSDDFTGTLSVKGSGNSAVGVIRHYDQDDSNYIDIQAPDTVASNYALTLPPNDGDSGQVLTTDGSGVLTWTSKTVDTTDLVSDTTPQLGGDLDTQAFSIGGTDIIPSADYAEGTSTQTGKGTRLTGTASDFGIRTIQSSGKQNIMLMADLDGSHSAGLDKTGLVYAPLNIQVRDRGEATKTRTTFDIQVPYISQTGTSITSSSGGTANILDVNTDDNVVFVENIAGTFATSDTMSAGPITGTITAIQDLSSNAKALYYSGGITGSTAQSDLADLGFARISTKTGMNNEGGLGGRSSPNLDIEAGTIAMDISTGQTLSPFGGFLSDASNMVEIKGGRYASGLRVYDASVGDGTKAGFQLDPFHFDKYLGSEQKKGGQFSIQLFGEGLPKESYGAFGESDALGVHQKFEIKDNSDYYIGAVNTVSGDATVTDNNYSSGTVTNVSGDSGDDFVTHSSNDAFADLSTGDEVTVPGAGSGGSDLVTTITNINDDKNELTLANNVETTVSNVTLAYTSGLFVVATAGDFIRIEGAVSDSNGNAMSGNLNCTITSVASNNQTIEINVPSSASSGKVLSDIVTGTNKTATLIRNSSTAIRMSAGTDEATHTFTHKSEQNGTNLNSNDRVNLAFEAKKITFTAGTDSSNVNAIQAEESEVQINQGQNDIDFRVHSASQDDLIKLDAGNNTLQVHRMRADSGTFADMPSLVRQTTSHYNYSLEVASDSTSTARTAGQVGGAFGFTHKADGVSDYYVGSINAVVGDEGTFGAAGENNNGIRLITYEDQDGFALNTVAEFRYATSEFMKGKLKFDYTSNAVTIETPTTNDNIKIKTNGSTGYLILENLPTSDPGVTGAVWNDSGTLKIST